MRDSRLSATDKLVMLGIEKLADDEGHFEADDRSTALLAAVVETPELLEFIGRFPTAEGVVIDGEIWLRADEIAALFDGDRDRAEEAVRELEAAGVLLTRVLPDGSTAYRAAEPGQR